MEPITLRIQTDLLSEIESEADELGYSSRAEYIRQLLQNRAHAREALSTDQTKPVVDPDVVTSNTEQIEAITADLEALQKRINQLEQQVEGETGSDDHNGTSPTADGSDAPEKTSNPMEDLEAWLENNGPQSDDAEAIIREAATILTEDGPLKAGELKQRLFKQFPDAYASANALWGSTIERVYEDAPGFSKPKYGTYDFE
jgi:Arc/MetJ-type ribon-helix-helix transcriptional regulator